MGHDPIMTRKILVVVIILVCGIVPDRFAGRGASSLRDSARSNLFNRADLERIERGYYEELLDQRPSPGRPRRRARPARTLSLGQHLVDPRRSIAAGHPGG